MQEIFEDEYDAIEWMHEQVDFDSCMDNIRISYVDDEKSKEEYDLKYAAGCCGYFDSDEIMIGNRVAFIGCNFGH